MLHVGTLKETIISITPAICVMLVTVQVLVMELEQQGGITAVLSTQKLVQHVVELMNMKLIGIATQLTEIGVSGNQPQTVRKLVEVERRKELERVLILFLKTVDLIVLLRMR